MSIRPDDYRADDYRADDYRAGDVANVLVTNGYYIHCGQPMSVWGTEMRSIHGTYNEQRLPETLGVYLATRVLHCTCGFQMEIPDQGHPVME